MNWKLFLLRFLRNIVVGTLLTMGVLGLIGYLLGGREGFENMLMWGLVLGLLGSFSSGLAMIVSAKYWGVDENYQYHPLWVWFTKKSDDDRKPDY
jgi:drug/metabolite transporter (DMT)-like permease